MNYVWFFAIAGGTALLGLVLAFNLVKQNGRPGIVPIVAASLVAFAALGLGLYVSHIPAAPTPSPDREKTQNKLPAAATPGKQIQPNQ
jgi:hypothetical protein